MRVPPPAAQRPSTKVSRSEVRSSACNLPSAESSGQIEAKSDANAPRVRRSPNYYDNVRQVGSNLKIAQRFFAKLNSSTIQNFGRNVVFHPRTVYAPRCEADVLDILNVCRGRRIHVIGRLHSWSDAPVADDVLLDLRHLRVIRIERRGDRYWVTTGAGCQIKRL